MIRAPGSRGQASRRSPKDAHGRVVTDGKYQEGSGSGSHGGAEGDISARGRAQEEPSESRWGRGPSARANTDEARLGAKDRSGWGVAEKPSKTLGVFRCDGVQSGECGIRSQLAACFCPGLHRWQSSPSVTANLPQGRTRPRPSGLRPLPCPLQTRISHGGPRCECVPGPGRAADLADEGSLRSGSPRHGLQPITVPDIGGGGERGKPVWQGGMGGPWDRGWPPGPPAPASKGPGPSALQQGNEHCQLEGPGGVLLQSGLRMRPQPGDTKTAAL